MPTIFEMWRDKQSMFLFRQRELKCHSWFTSALASLSVSLSDTHAYTNIQTRFISWRVEALWGISECSGCSLADGVGCGVLNIKPEGHCATRWPCGLRLCRITLGTTSSPTPAGVIRCWSNHTHKHYLSCCHITNTRGCHLLGACLSLLWPQTEVIDLEDCDSCRLGVADWLLGPHSNAIYCMGYLFKCIMWFHCHANRVWSRQAFDCQKWWVTHLMPWHWKIRRHRKQVMAHWEKRGNLLTVTFLLNVAWRRRINTDGTPEWKITLSNSLLECHLVTPEDKSSIHTF